MVKVHKRMNELNSIIGVSKRKLHYLVLMGESFSRAIDVTIEFLMKYLTAIVLVGFVSLRASEVNVVRIGESEARKAVLKKVDPEYPAMARQVRLTGQVQVDVLIAPTGAVEQVNILKGNALLSSSAVSALKKWKFTPFTGAGNKPTRAITSLTFDFRL